MKFTSIKCYQELVEKKIISKRCMEVVTVLKAYGPMTAGEVFKFNQIRHIGHNVVKGSICARLSELESQEMVQAVGQKKCSLTNKLATVWALTGVLPLEKRAKPKPKTIKTTKEKLEKALRRVIRSYIYPSDSLERPTFEIAFKAFMDHLNASDEVPNDS